MKRTTEPAHETNSILVVKQNYNIFILLISSEELVMQMLGQWVSVGEWFSIYS